MIRKTTKRERERGERREREERKRREKEEDEENFQLTRLITRRPRPSCSGPPNREKDARERERESATNLKNGFAEIFQKPKLI